MKATTLILAMCTVLLCGCEAPRETSAAGQERRPNVLLIVADDMGMTDIAPFGGEIDVPNIDALVQRGVRLTNFHTAPLCSPTRAMLMTGRDNHAVGLGTMAESLAVYPDLARNPGYEGYLSRTVPTIAEELRRRGYRTYMVGKWHLGKEDDQSPKARGFDRSFALLEGAGDHYGNDQGGPWQGMPAEAHYREDGKSVRFPIGRYSADFFTDQLIGYLREDAGRDAPFFAYLAYTQPHWPLQAPAESIAKYAGRYSRGWQVLRDERLARAKSMGIVPANFSTSDLAPMPDWDALSDDQKALEARKMEVYAAMLSRMDENIGRVIAELRTAHRLDNTIVIFLSDNGPSASGPPLSYFSQDQRKVQALGIDNRLENIGLPGSYTSYHAGWAIAGASPYRGTKGAVTEGGIHTPAIVAGPGVASAATVGTFAHAMDISATLLDIVDGRAGAIPPMEGRSWRQLMAANPSPDDGTRVTGWEIGFNRAIRRGDWKAVWFSNQDRFGRSTDAGGKWLLYDLSSDPTETHDLTTSRPDTVRELAELWDDYARRNHVVDSDSPTARPVRE